MLTPEEKKKLAEEAEKLAMECIDGGPKFAASDWCNCVCGEVVRRAGLATGDWEYHRDLSVELDGLVLNEEGDDPRWALGLLSIATMIRSYEHNPGAVVFPLLALRDALWRPNEPFN